MIEIVVTFVFQDRQAANHPIGFQREEEISVGVLIKRMLPPIEHPARIGRKRRHPLRHIAIELPERKIEKTAHPGGWWCQGG
ncbi:MAG: hypothetical protein U0559_19625 [Anaerolineae bacterium]